MTPQRRKSARQLAAEARRATAEKEVSQTIRDVYRKLAGALHPDRPSDELSEERKTALMQRVNQAYDSRNLLELLDIQFEVEQIDATDLARLSTKRLTHYIQVLREQLKDLREEIIACTLPYRDMVPNINTATPLHIGRVIDRDVRNLRELLDSLNADLALMQDPRELAIALRDYDLRAGA